VQNASRESVRQLLIDKIAKFELGSFFSVFETEISRAERLAHRIFKGTQSHNSENIKSLEGDDIAWVEEETSLRLLRPLAPKPRPQLRRGVFLPGPPVERSGRIIRLWEGFASAT
jgi:phage terminase large subunit